MSICQFRVFFFYFPKKKKRFPVFIANDTYGHYMLILILILLICTLFIRLTSAAEILDHQCLLVCHLKNVSLQVLFTHVYHFLLQTEERQVRKCSSFLERALLSSNGALSPDDWQAVPDIWRSSAEEYGDRVALVDPYHDPPSSITYKQVIFNFLRI